MRILFLAILWPLSLLLSEPARAWSTYFEWGTSLAKISSGNTFFGVASGAESSSLGFCGTFSFYVPVTNPGNIVHFDLGLQNRIYMVSATAGSLSMFTPSLAMRFELYRFFVGGGYAPIVFGSSDGVMSLKRNSAKTFFLEGGVIWRVVPELQITANYSMEYGMISGSSERSPSAAVSYGLSFRLPLSPYSTVGDASSKFDGYRYPFGIMK